MRPLLFIASIIAAFFNPYFLFLTAVVFASYYLIPAQGTAIDNQSFSTQYASTDRLFLRPHTGGFVAVIGESNYTSNLKTILENYDDARQKIVFTLLPEKNNKFDPNAVQIECDTLPVGYLSKPDAKKFRATHAAAIANGKPIVCWGKLVGGEEDKPYIGVFLDFNLDDEAIYQSDPLAA